MRALGSMEAEVTASRGLTRWAWVVPALLVGLLCGVALPFARAHEVIRTNGVHVAVVPLQLVDDRGHTVTLAAPPNRIVSLLPSHTETVCELGACAKLVGVDRWSNWPPLVRSLPRAGGLDDPNVELIAALKPDLVLVAPSARLAERLRALGLVVAELDAQDLPGVKKVFGQIGLLLGRQALATQRWQALDAEINAVAAQVPASARGTRVYFEVSSAPYAAGESSFIGQLLQRLGARNVVPASLGPFPKLNPEFVVRADPQLMVLSAADVPGLARRPGWAGMQALRLGRVCAIEATAYDVLARPGPRLGEAARLLAQCLSRPGKPGQGMRVPDVAPGATSRSRAGQP